MSSNCPLSRPKYLCVALPGEGPTIVVFGAQVAHAVMARLLGGKVMGAGFIERHGDELRCVGRSEGLDIDSRPTDTVLLQIQMPSLGDLA